MNRPLCSLGSLAVALFASATAEAQVHAPIQPAAVVIQDVVLGATDDASHMDIVVKDGRIVSIVPTGADLPPGARVYAGKGMLALPGFIDAWTTAGVEEPDPNIDQDIPVDVVSDIRAAMRAANRKGIAPTFRAADVLDFGADGPGAWRAEGFGTLLAAPDGDLLSGHGALIATRPGARRDLILNPEIFQFGEFSARGRGFPSTVMGYFSQLRQFFYDAERQALWNASFDAGNAVPRPAWDPTLEAGTMLLGGRELYVVQANDAPTIERWIRLAEEFDLRLAIAGGRDAHRHAARLAELKIPVILTMDLGEEAEDPDAPKDAKKRKGKPAADEGAAPPAESADDAEPAGEEAPAEDAEPSWHYEAPKAQKLEQRRRWEARRDNAKVLADAGVRVLFATGDRKPKEFMADLRKAVAAGLERDFALKALTADAALFVGASDHLGALAERRNATFAVWTADPLGEQAGDIALMLVDGQVFEFDVKEPGTGPDEGVDATGTWVLSIPDAELDEPPLLELEMDDEGRVTGTSIVVDPDLGETLRTAVTGSLSGKTLHLTGTLTMGEFAIKMTISGELNGDTLSGETLLDFPWGAENSKYTGTRRPEGHERETTDEHYSCMHATEAH